MSNAMARNVLLFLTFLGKDAGVEVKVYCGDTKMTKTLQEAKEQDFESNIGNMVMEESVKGLWIKYDGKRLWGRTQKGETNNLLALGSKGSDEVAILNVFHYALWVSQLHPLDAIPK